MARSLEGLSSIGLTSILAGVRRMVRRRRASGEATLRELERELQRSGGFMDRWQRVCEYAWRLGFTRLDLVPAPVYEPLCPRLRAVAPAGALPAGEICPPRQSTAPAGPAAIDAPAAWATWRIDVEAGKDVVAVLTAQRPLVPLDFDPRGFVRIVRDLVARKVVLPTVPLGRPERLGRRADPLGANANVTLPSEVEP